MNLTVFSGVSSTEWKEAAVCGQVCESRRSWSADCWKL